MTSPFLQVRPQAYHRTVLPNKLTIVSAPRREAESVAVGIWINVGGRYETPATNGVSHFLEHLLFKGTSRFSSRQIKERIEGSGGVLNAFTDEEFTCVWAKVQPKNLRPALEVLTEMVLFPTLEGREVEKERAVVLEEIRMYRDLPMQSVHDLLNSLLWPDHPLGMNLAGTEKSMARIQRKNLLTHQKKFYTPRNVVIAACGKLHHRDLVEEVRRFWERVPSGALHPFRRVSRNPQGVRMKVEKKETEQTHLCLGFRAFPRNHPQVHALNLLNVVLGGNMSSRLFQRVREERGLAYEIGSQVRRFRDTGLFSISAGVEHKNFLPCLRVVLEELARIRRKLVTPREFDRAVEFFVGQILFALEDTVEHMCWMGECEMLLGRVEPAEKVLRQVSRVRRGDLTSIAGKLLAPRCSSLAVIGPPAKRTSEGLQRLLQARR